MASKSYTVSIVNYKVFEEGQPNPFRNVWYAKLQRKPYRFLPGERAGGDGLPVTGQVSRQVFQAAGQLVGQQ